jgi:hypothetical protein
MRWSEAIAVGSLVFVETVKSDLGVKDRHRDVIEVDGTAPQGAFKVQSSGLTL